MSKKSRHPEPEDRPASEDYVDLTYRLEIGPNGEANMVEVSPPKIGKVKMKVIGLRNADQSVGVNPKDRIGATKVDPTVIPRSAKIALALALMDGGEKYGLYNWRKEPVQLRTYLGAAERHLDDFLDGQQNAGDSLIAHLGHAMACCAIIIDAIDQGTFVDDRPICREGRGAAFLYEEGAEFIKQNKPEGWGR